MDTTIYDVKRRHAAHLFRIAGVVGVGVSRGTDGGLVIAIHVDKDDASLTEQLPRELEGYPVEAIHSGPFKKL